LLVCTELIYVFTLDLAAAPEIRQTQQRLHKGRPETSILNYINETVDKYYNDELKKNTYKGFTFHD